MGFGKSLSYVCSGYSSSQILCFILVVVFKLLRSQVWIPFLSKRCSHIFVGVLILLIIVILMSILFQPVRFSSSQFNPFHHLQDQFSVPSQRWLFHPSQFVFFFAPPPHPFFLHGVKILKSSIHFIHENSLHPFFLQYSNPVNSS